MLDYMTTRENSSKTSIANCIKQLAIPRGRQKTAWIQSTDTLLQPVGLDNLGSSKLRESANDMKTWEDKTDEVFRALYSA